MEKISSNLKNQKEGCGVGLKTIGIRAALQLHIISPNLCITVAEKQDNRPKVELLMLSLM